MTAPRLLHVDVLRGLAVFGILLVNIWSFAWGTSALRYGVLPPEASVLDDLAVFGVALLAELKFYPIFAFLFGAGFALQTRSLKRQLGSWQAAQARYWRRLTWLLGCGILHGMLVWSGDVLTSYAFSGLLILRLASAPARRICRVLLTAGLTFAAIILALYLLLGVVISYREVNDIWLAADNLRAVYSQGSLLDIAWQRAGDYLAAQLAGVLMLPHTIALFLLGMLAVRLGWLTRPGRHRAAWRRVRLIGLGLGLPLNFLWACAALLQALNPHQSTINVPLLEYLMYFTGPLLAAGYVAALVLAREPVLAVLANWLEPVGRMALSNYLLQSVAGTLLLQGSGLGWAATFTPAQLMLLAFAMMLVQAGLSRWWMARYEQGPVEALWRHYVRGVR